MTIVRSRHPFEGRALDVLGWSERRGRLHLLLVLPDGTRSLVPADWTDLSSAQRPISDAASVQRACLASCDHLLRARLVVDALLQRTEASPASATPNQEDEHGAANEIA